MFRWEVSVKAFQILFLSLSIIICLVIWIVPIVPEKKGSLAVYFYDAITPPPRTVKYRHVRTSPAFGITLVLALSNLAAIYLIRVKEQSHIQK